MYTYFDYNSKKKSRIQLNNIYSVENDIFVFCQFI